MSGLPSAAARVFAINELVDLVMATGDYRLEPVNLQQSQEQIKWRHTLVALCLVNRSISALAQSYLYRESKVIGETGRHNEQSAPELGGIASSLLANPILAGHVRTLSLTDVIPHVADMLVASMPALKFLTWMDSRDRDLITTLPNPDRLRLPLSLESLVISAYQKEHLRLVEGTFNERFPCLRRAVLGLPPSTLCYILDNISATLRDLYYFPYSPSDQEVKAEQWQALAQAPHLSHLAIHAETPEEIVVALQNMPTQIQYLGVTPSSATITLEVLTNLANPAWLPNLRRIPELAPIGKSEVYHAPAPSDEHEIVGILKLAVKGLRARRYWRYEVKTWDMLKFNTWVCMSASIEKKAYEEWNKKHGAEWDSFFDKDIGNLSAE